jgi:Tol biopolymer transport system component
MRADGSEPKLLVPGRTFLPEVSPDGRFILYVTNIGTNVPVVRAARLVDGVATPFELRAGNDRLGSVGTGRSRWMPDGKAIATIGFDEGANRCIWIQDFSPDKDTSATRRTLVAPGAELNIDTFGLSPDGRQVSVEHLEELSSVAMAEGVEGIRR